MPPPRKEDTMEDEKKVSKYTEAQKRSARKWDAANLDRLSVAAPKGTKARWKAAAEVQGKSLNQFIVDTVEMAVEGHKAPVQAQADTVGYLSPGTLEAAQRAIEATGEALEQFVERAVETQAKRDMTSLRLGINPASGERLVKAPERPQESD